MAYRKINDISTSTLTIRIPDELLAFLDKRTGTLGINRSQLISMLLERHQKEVQQNQPSQMPSDRLSQLEQLAGVA